MHVQRKTSGIEAVGERIQYNSLFLLALAPV